MENDWRPSRPAGLLICPPCSRTVSGGHPYFQPVPAIIAPFEADLA